MNKCQKTGELSKSGGLLNSGELSRPGEPLKSGGLYSYGYLGAGQAVGGRRRDSDDPVPGFCQDPHGFFEIFLFDQDIVRVVGGNGKNTDPVAGQDR